MEDVFDLREFLIKILRQWRLLVVIMILMGITGSFFRLFQLRDQLFGATTPPVIEEIHEDEHNEMQRLLNATQVENVVRAINTIENLLLELDHITQEASYSLQYYMTVVAEDTTRTEQLMNLLTWRITLNDGFFQHVSSHISNVISAENLPEFIFIESLSAHGLIRVTVRGGTPEFCIAVSSAVREYIENINMSMFFGEGYYIMPINVDAVPIQDIALFQRRVELLSQLQAYREIFNTMNLETEITVYTPLFIEGTARTLYRLNVIRSSAQFGLLGAVGGLVVGIVLVFFIDVMSVRIKDSKELIKKLGINLLAEVRSDDKGRLFSRVDRLVDKLDGNSQPALSQSDAMDKLCAEIAVTLKNNRKGYRIYITGMAPFAVLSKMYELISAGLIEDGVECVMGGNLLVSGEAIRTMIDCDGVLLVEKSGCALLPEVEKEKIIIHAAGKDILAAVWVA